MNKVISIEIKKSMKTKGFLVALCVGLIIAILQCVWFYKNIYSVNQLEMSYVLNAGVSDKLYGYWFQNGILEGWMGCELYSQYNQLFFMVFPLLASLPYAVSLYREFRSGYTSQMVTRCGRGRYYISKFIAVFISGGLVVMLPLLLNFLISACYLPVIPIDPMSLQAVVTGRDMWGALYYEKPLCYAAAYMGVDFVYGGIFACVSLAVTFLFNNAFSILAFPFILSYFLMYGIDNLAYRFQSYNVADIINPAQVSCSNYVSAFVITTIVSCVVVIITYGLSVRRRDIRKER